jgi:hypothetical protein
VALDGRLLGTNREQDERLVCLPPEQRVCRKLRQYAFPAFRELDGSKVGAAVAPHKGRGGGVSRGLAQKPRPKWVAKVKG